MKRQVSPPSSISSSTGSTVVPATLSTTTRSSPASLLSSEDLPTFGLPTIAIRRGPPTSSKLCGRRLGQRGENGVEHVARAAAVQRGDRVRLPQPEVPEAVGLGLGALVVDLVGGEHDRLASDARRILTTASSASVIPTVASTTNSTASARLTAISAWARIASARPRASGSQPPVSTTVKARPFQLASYETRSRVTPGTSSTTASRRPMIRLTSVDLPTLGRPTTASTGTGPRASGAASVVASGVGSVMVLLGR